MAGFRKLRDYFHFNQGERRGLIILFAILTMIILFNALSPLWFRPKEYDFSTYEATAAEFYKRQQQIADSLKQIKDNKSRKPVNRKKPSLRSFDPNITSESGWMEMGLSKKQAAVILNYIEKGGRFKKASDLSKIYSLSKSEYLMLKPYIEITDTPISKNHMRNNLNNKDSNNITYSIDSIRNNPKTQDTHINSPTHSASEFRLELNSADTLDLQLLPGIGPSYARRIVKYRELLGGFFHREQLMEVYGMDSLRYTGFINQVIIDTALIHPIPVNNATISNLVRHPYIDYFLAKTIISNRSKNGLYKSSRDFQSRLDLPSKIFEKIKIYLQVKAS